MACCCCSTPLFCHFPCFEGFNPITKQATAESDDSTASSFTQDMLPKCPRSKNSNLTTTQTANISAASSLPGSFPLTVISRITAVSVYHTCAKMILPQLPVVQVTTKTNRHCTAPIMPYSPGAFLRRTFSITTVPPHRIMPTRADVRSSMNPTSRRLFRPK